MKHRWNPPSKVNWISVTGCLVSTIFLVIFIFRCFNGKDELIYIAFNGIAAVWFYAAARKRKMWLWR